MRNSVLCGISGLLLGLIGGYRLHAYLLNPCRASDDEEIFGWRHCFRPWFNVDDDYMDRVNDVYDDDFYADDEYEEDDFDDDIISPELK